MLGFCRHQFAPLTTVIIFGSRLAALEQCVLCEKLRGQYVSGSNGSSSGSGTGGDG